jgi:hypothetical protein
MLLNLSKSSFRHIFLLQFVIKGKVMVSPIKIESVDVDEQSENLTEDVPPEDSLRNESQNSIQALYWIFWCDISISDGGHKLNAIIHDICVFTVPCKKGYLVEGPTIVNPDYVGSVGSVVVGVVELHADDIEEDSHEMRVNDGEYYQFTHKKDCIFDDVELSQTLELIIYAVN